MCAFIWCMGLTLVLSGQTTICSSSTSTKDGLEANPNFSLPQSEKVTIVNAPPPIRSCSLISLAAKFELRAQLHSAEIKMSLHVPNCKLNDFYVLTLPLAMGSDAVPKNLQRHLHASLWIASLCRLGVFTSAIEEKMVKQAFRGLTK